MKKIYTALFTTIIMLSTQLNAQLNYIFSTANKPYVPVTGGITPHLTTDYTGWAPEDEGFAKVPIGFRFNYNGTNYDSANVDVNGFITFTDSLNIGFNYQYFQNNLSTLPNFGQRPIIAALWDDLLLLDTSYLVYKTTGFAPSRVFTVEWKKVKWSYDAPNPVLSIELKLYETTNIIEFHYKDEGGIPYQQFAFASIGITAADVNRDFVSLQSTSADPQISLLKSIDSLAQKPADNQVYRFIPAAVPVPEKFRRSYSYTNNKLFLQLHSGELNGYEYAVTHSPIPPSSGTKTTSGNIAVFSLNAATTYYTYARSLLPGNLYSQWVCDSFTTADKPVPVPYHISGSNLINYLPADMREQDFTDTSLSYFPGQSGWEEITDFPHVGDTCLDGGNTFYDADDWAFTPGIKLSAGKTYQLKFGYLSYYEYNPGDPSKVEIKYGTAAGFAGMNSGTLFKKTIRTYAHYDENGGLPFRDTTIEFTPATTDVYYFGVHNLSINNYYSEGGFPIIGNFSISEKNSSPIAPLFALKGSTDNVNNILSWNNNNINNIQIQRSNDGINFINLATIKNQNNNIVKPRNFTRTDVHDVNYWNQLKGKSKVEYEKMLPLLSVSAQSESSKSSHLAKNTSPDYVDKNVQGTNYYRMQYIDANGSTVYSNIIVLRDNAVAGQLSAYPNPAKNLITVKVTLTGNEKMRLNITDNSGKTMLTKTISIGTRETIIQVDVSHFYAGTYFIKLISDDGDERAIEKFIKQ